MKATIITIGDEILIGQIVDSNSAWIGSRLNDYGIAVDSRISVGDSREAILDTLGRAIEQNDLVIVTGGLGPTRDDITKSTLAELFGCGMHRDERVFEMNREMLTSRGIEYNELNQGQATVPDKCEVLLNASGTAPGMWFEEEHVILVSLPGVPFEMEALMEEQVLPRLKEFFKPKSVIHKTVATSGIAESVLAQTIAEWESALPEMLHLAYLPNMGRIRLRLSAYDVEREVAERLIGEEFEKLAKIIPDNLLGCAEETTVEREVAKALTERGAKLSIAESCTGGAITKRFTANSGASAFLEAGVVSYSGDAKVGLLGVDKEVIERYGVVSREVAEQMALGVKQKTQSDYAIATTGIAGPTGGTEETPLGTIWVAIAHPEGVVSSSRIFGKRREQNIERATEYAINLLRLILKGKKV